MADGWWPPQWWASKRQGDEGWPSDRHWRWRWCTPPLVLVHFTNRSSPAACQCLAPAWYHPTTHQPLPGTKTPSPAVPCDRKQGPYYSPKFNNEVTVGRFGQERGGDHKAQISQDQLRGEGGQGGGSGLPGTNCCTRGSFMSFLIPTVIPLTSHNFISLVYDNHMMNASVLGILCPF